MADPLDAKARLVALHGTAQALSARSSEPEVIEVLLERSLSAVSGHRACLHLLSPDGRELLPAGDCTARGEGRVPGVPVPVAECSLFERVVRDEVVIVREPGRLQDPLLAAVAGDGANAVVAAVLAARDHPLGMLMVLVDPGVELGEEDRLALHIVADLAAITLEKTRQQQSLLSIAEALNGTLEVEPMLQRVLAATVQNLWLKAASIRLLDRKRRVLRLAAAHGLGDGDLARSEVAVDSDSIAGRALRGEPVVLTDDGDEEGPPYPDDMAREGIHSMLAIAIRQKDVPVGVVRVYSAQRRRFGSVAVRFLSSVASLVALALENAHLYGALRERCRDLEVDLADWHRFLALG